MYYYLSTRRLIDLITSFVRTCTVDHDEVVRTAKTHGSGDDDDSLFSSALSFVSQNKVRREVPCITVYLRFIHIPRVRVNIKIPLTKTRYKRHTARCMRINPTRTYLRRL